MEQGEHPVSTGVLSSDEQTILSDFYKKEFSTEQINNNNLPKDTEKFELLYRGILYYNFSGFNAGIGKIYVYERSMNLYDF